MLLRFLAPFLIAVCVQAQEPPAATSAPVAPQPAPLEYTGKPVVLPFKCTTDDLTWGGLSCTDDEPCAVYLELSGVEPAGNRLVVAGNIHSSAVTLYSVLLTSEDGGHTWREAYNRIRGAGLDHLQFVDGQTGWVSGETLFPLPQDPFVLATTDGGKTWVMHQIFGENTENRFGAVQQMYFSGKTSGSVVIDRGDGAGSERFAQYDSPDGETWMIKQEGAKPIHLKVPEREPSDWRLRADGPTQAYVVEHHQGERWTKVAAFAVKLAPCKPGTTDGGPAGLARP